MSGGETFVKLPTSLLYDPDVPDGVLRAYMALARYAILVSSDTFEMTGEQLGTLLGRSRDQADRRLNDLIARGLVVVEGNRGRARPNRITVLDPQGVVFAGLHVERASADAPKEASADLRKPGSAEVPKPYKKEGEERGGQRSKRSASALDLPSPVDNGGAPRPPSPRHTASAIRDCALHRGQPAHNCGPCRSERIAGPAF